MWRVRFLLELSERIRPFDQSSCYLFGYSAGFRAMNFIANTYEGI